MDTLERLSEAYDRECEIHRKNTPVGLPIGGGDWMDSLFRMEALRGAMAELEAGKTNAEALAAGIAAGRLAIRTWNGRREYQVHRWEGSIDSYLERMLR